MKSEELFSLAKTLIPGGVSSPVRAIKPYPFYTAKQKDRTSRPLTAPPTSTACMGYGPLLLGTPARRSKRQSQTD